MSFYIVIPLILALFGGINYYIGRRGWQWLQATNLRPSRLVYWPLFWLLALSFLLTRLVSDWLPPAIGSLLAQISGYWMAIFVYGLLLLLLVDVIRLLNWLGLIPSRLIPDVNLTRYAGAAVIAVLMALMLYGTWSARTPVVREYAISIPKPAGAHTDLHVVLVSDTHLGAIIGNSRIRQLVRTVNSLEPDLVLLAGDIIDDDIRPFLEQNMAAELRQINSRLGTYGVPGNHDPGSGELAAFRTYMEQAGIHLLADQWVTVDDSFIVAGRADSSGFHRGGGGSERLPLDQVLVGTDPTLPILLMDHQPNRLDEAQAAGVDLQVSGHTHRGQLFPGSLITSRVYEVDWGYLKKGATNFVVSLGYGTWGPPIRVGNRPEVVSIRIHFGE